MFHFRSEGLIRCHFIIVQSGDQFGFCLFQDLPVLFLLRGDHLLKRTWSRVSYDSEVPRSFLVEPRESVLWFPDSAVSRLDTLSD